MKPDPETLARLEAALQTMPITEREIFLAVRLDGLDFAEIAHRTGRTPKAVERCFAAALRHILQHMSEAGGR